MTELAAAEHEPFARVSAFLAAKGHPHAPIWLQDSARTVADAAAALGVEPGQIAKSVIFRRKSDNAAVLVVTAGDQRVDERKVAELVGAIGRADADFVKSGTGFSIGGVSPVAHSQACVTLLDQSLWRFAQVWAAAGHPKGVFAATPDELAHLTGAPAHSVTLIP
jgi:prolyl-tRNA editing enzyme YbaK/EbsC (Cys-tRNA(Pro) deacylase)